MPNTSAEAEPKASASVRFGGRRYSAELRPKLRYYSVAIYCKIYLSFSAKMRRRRLVPSFVIFIIYAFKVFNLGMSRFRFFIPVSVPVFLAQKTGGSGSGSGFQKQHISPRGALQNSNDTFAGLEE